MSLRADDGRGSRESDRAFREILAVKHALVSIDAVHR
jgi:hypothetical protein